MPISLVMTKRYNLSLNNINKQEMRIYSIVLCSVIQFTYTEIDSNNNAGEKKTDNKHTKQFTRTKARSHNVLITCTNIN